MQKHDSRNHPGSADEKRHSDFWAAAKTKLRLFGSQLLVFLPSVFPKSPPPHTNASAWPPLLGPRNRKRVQKATGCLRLVGTVDGTCAAPRSSCTSRSRDICVYQLHGDVAFAEVSDFCILPRAFCAAAALPPLEIERRRWENLNFCSFCSIFKHSGSSQR